MHEPPHAHWRKSRHSGTGNNCVEIARLAGAVVAVRDSKNAEGGILIVPLSSWKAVARQMKNGTFDA